MYSTVTEIRSQHPIAGVNKLPPSIPLWQHNLEGHKHHGSIPTVVWFQKDFLSKGTLNKNTVRLQDSAYDRCAWSPPAGSDRPHEAPRAHLRFRGQDGCSKRYKRDEVLRTETPQSRLDPSTL